MPKVFLPIALMVLGTIKLPGEHHFNDAEAEHALEQLDRLGHGPQPVQATSVPLDKVTPQDALETLAEFLQQGEIAVEVICERLQLYSPEQVKQTFEKITGEALDRADQRVTELVDKAIEAIAPPAEVEVPEPVKEAEKPAETELVIPPAVVKELVKAGFIITKPETIQVADDEALLAVKGMTPELLARVRQITG